MVRYVLFLFFIALLATSIFMFINWLMKYKLIVLMETLKQWDRKRKEEAENAIKRINKK